MTAPLRDVLRIDGEDWLFDSHDHRAAIVEVVDVAPVGFSTACVSGVFYDLVVDEGVVVVDRISLYGGRASVRAFPAISVGGSSAAVPAQVAGAFVTLPSPVDEAGLVVYRAVGLRLRASGTWWVGRAPRRQAMALFERRAIVVVDGRVVEDA